MIEEKLKLKREDQFKSKTTIIFSRDNVLEAFNELTAIGKDNIQYISPLNLSEDLIGNAVRLFYGHPIIFLTDHYKNEILKFDSNADFIDTPAAINELQCQEKIFVPLFKFDLNALPYLKRIQECNGRYLPMVSGQKNSYRFINEDAHDAILATYLQLNRISHWAMETHENIAEALEMTKHVAGAVLEVGVYKGGTALTALNYLEISSRGKTELTKREVFLFDTFDGFGKGERNSVDPIWSGTHQIFGSSATIKYVSETLETAGYKYSIQALNIISEKLPIEIGSISFAHIDVDSYLATSAALKKIAPIVSIGGIMLLEDPAGTPLLYGAFLAMHEFLGTADGKKFLCVLKTSHYLLIRSA
jgi:hypothetical protein